MAGQYRVAPDGLVARLENADLEVLMVVGHADRLGSQACNQLLAERRAALAPAPRAPGWAPACSDRRADIEATGSQTKARWPFRRKIDP